MSSYELDRYFPLQGTCFDCGRDLRHKLFDRINQRFSAGESVAALAAVYRVPHRAIELVLGQNSVTPLGLTFKPTLRSRTAAA
jgi:hypothetical protein